MHFSVNQLRITLFGIGIFFLVSFPASARAENAIIAVVNDELITKSDLDDYRSSVITALEAEGTPAPQLAAVKLDLDKNGLMKLIEDKLILSEANKLGIQLNERAIDQKVEEIKQKYGGEQGFLAALVKHGATVTDLRNKIIDQLKIKYTLEEKIKAKVIVNPQEITDYYNQHPEEFRRGERVTVDSIYIPIAANNTFLAKKQADEAYTRLQKGEAFDIIAKTYSASPSIGTVERGQLKETIENEIFKLNAGEFSPPVVVDTGIYIFKAREKFAAQQAPLDDMKKPIEEYLYQKKLAEKFTSWIEGLKKNAYIEIKK